MRQRHTTSKHLAKMHNMTSSAKNSCVCKYYQDSQIHELAANSEKDSRRVSWGFYSAVNRHHSCCKILWLIKLAVYSPLALLLRLCLYIYMWTFLHIFFGLRLKKISMHTRVFLKSSRWPVKSPKKSGKGTLPEEAPQQQQGCCARRSQMCGLTVKLICFWISHWKVQTTEEKPH